MIIIDHIYGRFDIKSSVLIELINSKTIQRLKGISQMGLPEKYFHIKCFSRYEHSIGVMLLLKKLGAGEKEQISGLLHDASHTAFSHLIDWVEDRVETEDYQDLIHRKYMLISDAVPILKKWGYDPEEIIDIKKFSLLEQPIPELCADRIDYSIRQFSDKNIKYYLDSLTVKNNKIVFSNKRTALLFAMEFLDRQQNMWASSQTVWRWYLLYLILITALRKKIIKKADFWKDDDFILKKIAKAKNKNIIYYQQILSNRNQINLPLSGQKIRKKFRYVDPKYIYKNKVHRLSKTDSDFKLMLSLAKKSNRQGILLPDID